MSPPRVVVVVVCIVVLAGGWLGWRWLQPEVSGIYIAADPAAVVFLQLVETPEHHLSGRFEGSTLKQDGTIDRSSGPVSGDINGANIVLTLRPLAPLPVDIVASGTFGMRQINVTASGWEFSGQAVFVRSDMATYQARLTDLGARSRALVAARAAAEARQREAEARQRAAEAEAQERQREAETRARQVAQIRQFMTQIPTIRTALNDRLKSFPEWEQRYRDITDKMGAYLEREQRIPIGWQSSNARIQLSLEIGKGPLASDQIHIAIENHHQGLETTRGNLGSSFDVLRQTCSLAHEDTPERPIPADQAEWNTTCLQALAAEPDLRSLVGKVVAGYQHVEVVYQQEVARQKQIEEAASRIANQ